MCKARGTLLSLCWLFLPYRYGIIICMKKTLHIDEKLLSEAKLASGAVTDTDTATVTIHLDGSTASVSPKPGETLLESARRAGLAPPFSCEAGNCGTCMALLKDGSATMRVNDALTEDEVDDGYVLTCQAVPDTPCVTVTYDE